MADRFPILEHVENLEEHFMEDENGSWNPIQPDQMSDAELGKVMIGLGGKTAPKKLLPAAETEGDNQRFANVSDADLDKITATLHKKQTKSQSKWAVNIFRGKKDNSQSLAN